MNKIILTAYILLPTINCNAQAMGYVSKLPVDETTQKITIDHIYNVYNRTRNQVIRYAIEYCEKHSYSYRVDSSKDAVLAQVSYIMKTGKRECLANPTVTMALTFFARDGRTKIEFTNMTYSAEGKCGASGVIEDLLKCDQCKDFSGFSNWVNQCATAEMTRYHSHLKDVTKSAKDW